MKILVPIKRVIDPYAKVRPLADGSGLDTSDSKFEINPFDEIAMEEAVRMKEANPEIVIVAVSIGESECEDQLRKALAMGADEAILVKTSDDMDSMVIAAELKALVDEIQPKLILMGKQSTDGDSNQAGQMLAALLDWPQATFAAKIELGEESAIVTRETDSGEEVLSLPYPCLITTDLRLNEPRFITLPRIVKARSKPLEVRDRATQTQSKTTILSYTSPPARQAGVKVNSVDELISALKEKGAF